jgi:hypothetical protein
VICTVNAAPCIQFGAPGLTLNLVGFTITGQGDPATGCQGAHVGNATVTLPFLIAVNRIIGRNQIQNDLSWHGSL